MKVKEMFKKIPKGLKVTLIIAAIIIGITTIPTRCSHEKITVEGEGGEHFTFSNFQKHKVTNPKTNETVLENATIWWYTNNDSICVFFDYDNRKRGYINIETYEIISEAQYDFAWKFSEGLAAVCKNGKMGFIDKTGRIAIDYQFKYYTNDDYVFHDSVCYVGGFQEKGAINHQGNLIVPLKYYYLESTPSGILAKQQKGFHTLYDYKGNIIHKRIFDSIVRLKYTIRTADSENAIEVNSDYCKYEVNGKYGLVDTKGTIITEPIYGDINAISNEMFIVNINDYYYDMTFMDNQGNIIDKPLKK